MIGYLYVQEGNIKFLPIFIFSLFHPMPRAQIKQSKTLAHLFGTTDDCEVSQKLIKKLLQYNMKYEEMAEVLGTSVGALKASYHHAASKVEKFISGN